MLLHYLVKYECRKTGGNLKYVLWLMMNHKIAQPCISDVTGHFVTNLSFNLLAKTYIRCDGAYKREFVANLPLSLSAKEF